MQTDEWLNEAISVYAEDKKKHDALKKLTEDENKRIKEELLERNVDEFVAGDLTAKISIQNRETLDEEKLIHTLEHMTYHTENCAGPICVATGLDIVKMKPYVDMEALEEAIYSGALSDEQILEIGKCKESKEVVTLRVSKTKKREEE